MHQQIQKMFQYYLKKIEKETNIFLSDKQKEAIEAVNDNNVCVITGEPGTRKNNNYKKYDRTLSAKRNESSIVCSNR